MIPAGPENHKLANVDSDVRSAMERLSESFPAGLQYHIPFNTTKFVSAAIHKVNRTLIEAGILVLIVILAFLQDWRSVLVPATTVPVTIIGAFGFMAALGFTVNMLTLASASKPMRGPCVGSYASRR